MSDTAASEKMVDHPGTVDVPEDGVIVVIVKADGTVDRYVRDDVSTEQFIAALRELADVEEADLEASK